MEEIPFTASNSFLSIFRVRMSEHIIKNIFVSCVSGQIFVVIWNFFASLLVKGFLEREIVLSREEPQKMIIYETKEAAMLNKKEKIATHISLRINELATTTTVD